MVFLAQSWLWLNSWDLGKNLFRQMSRWPGSLYDSLPGREKARSGCHLYPGVTLHPGPVGFTVYCSWSLAFQQLYLHIAWASLVLHTSSLNSQLRGLPIGVSDSWIVKRNTFYDRNPQHCCPAVSRLLSQCKDYSEIIVFMYHIPKYLSFLFSLPNSLCPLRL